MWNPFVLSKVSLLRAHGVTKKQSLFEAAFNFFRMIANN